MAKKAELLEEAKSLNLEVSEKNTIAEITEAINNSKDADVKEKPDTSSLKKNEDKEEQFAKAGKRSKKAAEEAGAEAAKQAKKESDEEEQPVKKGPAPKTRSKLERRGKKYRKAAESIDKSKKYSLKDAVELAQKSSTTKFDGSLEIHINLNVDPKHADQNIRGNIVLPNGTGNEVRVAVFADEDNAKKAKTAGADIAMADEFLKKLDKEEIDFDVLISTPQNMAKLGKYAKNLGPKGLMPNPKSGTVATDVAKAVKEAKAGRVEYRVDKGGIVHMVFGKVSFGTDKLAENAQAILTAVTEARPASVKSDYITSIVVSASMGPGVKVAA